MANMGEVGALPALKNSLDVMNQHELRLVIPQIIKSMTGVRPQYGNQNMKPKWWPFDLPYCNPRDDFRDQAVRQKPWTDVLRNIVRNCYQYYGQEHLLNGHDPDKENPIKVVNNQDGSVSFITNTAVVTLEDRQNTPYASCPPPTMEAATPGRSLSASTGAPQPTGLFKSTSPPSKRTSNRAPPQVSRVTKPFVEVFMCYFCEKEFHHKSALQAHQEECELWSAQCKQPMNQPVTRSRAKSEVVRIVPRKPRVLIEENVSFPAKGLYIESLDLLPQAKAESVRRQSQGKKIDVEVLEVDESKPPKTPTTPRTPKSLISQLSRDVSPPARVKLKISESVLEENLGEVTDSVKDSSDEESDCGKSDSGEDNYRPRRAATLLNIDISSPLGERVQKHICAYFANLENYQTSPDSSGKSYESFCRTPTKVKVTERLRSRAKENFQVTFRKTKRTAPKHYHRYKFRRSELSEFCRSVETGLNRRSRALKKKVQKCKVVLYQLTDEDIRRWNHRFKSFNKSSRTQHMSNTREDLPQRATLHKANYSLLKPSAPSSKNLKQIERLLCGDGNIVRQLELSGVVLGPDNKESVHQRLLYQALLSRDGPAGVTASPADLTPPSTPEEVSPDDDDDDDIICLDDSGSCDPSSVTRSVSTSNASMRKSSSNSRGKGPTSRGQHSSSQVGDHTTLAQMDEDIISISSADSDDDLTVVSPESLKRPSNWSPTTSDLPAKRRRIQHLRPSALLFRCHLCFEEITCHDNANLYIKGHFAEKHDVYNIDLIEHLDPNGQKVVSIVEVPTPEKQAPPSSFVLTASKAKTAAVTTTKFYAGQKKDSQNKVAARTKQQAEPQARTKTTVAKKTSRTRTPSVVQKKAPISASKSSSKVTLTKSAGKASAVKAGTGGKYQGSSQSSTKINKKNSLKSGKIGKKASGKTVSEVKKTLVGKTNGGIEKASTANTTRSAKKPTTLKVVIKARSKPGLSKTKVGGKVVKSLVKGKNGKK